MPVQDWRRWQTGPAVAKPKPEPAPVDDDGKAGLQAEAEALGVTVDKRWGVKRLADEILAAREVVE